MPIANESCMRVPMLSIFVLYFSIIWLYSRIWCEYSKKPFRSPSISLLLNDFHHRCHLQVYQKNLLMCYNECIDTCITLTVNSQRYSHHSNDTGIPYSWRKMSVGFDKKQLISLFHYAYYNFFSLILNGLVVLLCAFSLSILFSLIGPVPQKRMVNLLFEIIIIIPINTKKKKKTYSTTYERTRCGIRGPWLYASSLHISAGRRV